MTPDSFSDGGRYDSLDAALFHAQQMVREGADIIDIEGNPPARDISGSLTRKKSAVWSLSLNGSDRNLTFHSPLTLTRALSQRPQSALEADLVNDIWGLKYDPKIAAVIAESGTACCLMHNRDQADYNDFTVDFIDDMRECIKLADEAGISRDKIILDPGVGFGKTYEMNLTIINRLEILHELGLPVLLGTSRKSVIGLTLDLPADQREEGTLVTTVYAVQKGCAFVRVHDVEKNKRAIRMTQALMQERRCF